MKCELPLHRAKIVSRVNPLKRLVVLGIGIGRYGVSIGTIANWEGVIHYSLCKSYAVAIVIEN